MRHLIGISLFLWIVSLTSFAQNVLVLESPAIAPNSNFPLRFTCKGADKSPPLHWKDNQTLDTQSFVLTLSDPDAPNGYWDHWVLYNIPASVRELKEGDDLPDNTSYGLNSWGKKVYKGPCPLESKHRYIFTLYALNVRLDLHPIPTKSEILDAMQGHVNALTELIVLYSSSP